MTKKPIAIGFMLFTFLWFAGCESQTTAQVANKETNAEANNTEKESILSVLKANDDKPVEERVALFYKLREENPEGYDFDNEGDLNIYGYGLLWEGKADEAVEIFKLVVAEFPESANAYDSLGEGYLAIGNSELSLVNYKKAFAMNPDNFGAEDKIYELEHPDYTPPTPAELFVKTFTPEEYRADLDQLGKRLMQVHPAVFKFTSEAEFLQNIENQKAAITPETTYAEFSWMCSNIIASVNCSHTSLGRFFNQNAMLPMAKRFPVQTRWIDNKLYVTDPLNNNKKVKVKDEITSINGVDVAEIIDDIYKHISSQGYIETMKRNEFNQWSTGMIAYALDFPNSYTVMVKGRDNPIALNKAETSRDPMPDLSIKRCSNNLCLDFLDNGKDAILTISSFNYYPWSDLDVFVKFVDSSFVEINKKGIENLVVDVRFNGGGSPESSVYLLRHISDKPFIYFSHSGYNAPEMKGTVYPFDNAFKGQCYFMMDGWGNSTTGHFMSMVKTLDLGPIVGEELGANQFCTGGGTPSRLKNTRLMFYSGDNNNETTATELPDEVGILPDYFVSQSIDDYLNNKDVVKEYTLELISQGLNHGK